MFPHLNHSLAFVLLASSALSPQSSAADAKAGAKTAKKEPGRTSNRGPENPELKFKLPPPRVLTPAEELKTIKVAKGFRVELVASEPMIGTPVAMSWDDQGRIYVCEMAGYMNDIDAKGEDQPIGRVSRLEDKDGDGVFETATVFADKLFMPRSVTAFGDGCIIGEPPNLIWYHDTDGDGVGDKKEVIADNFGTKGGQPEHMANALTFCMDNWLWGAGYGQRLRWVKDKFISEPTRSGGQWGLTQDDWGRRYFNYNSDFLRSDLLPPSVYARNPNLADKLALNSRVMNDQSTWPAVATPGVNRGYNPGQLRPNGALAVCTATGGACIYRGDLFPKEFRGNAFIPEPAGQLVKRVILSETGGVVTGRNAYEGTEFLTSTDERFRPVNAYNGPDGALYIVDIARGIIQHRTYITHYLEANIKARQLEQPVNLGRIWRVVPDKAKPKAVKLPRSKGIQPLPDQGRQNEQGLNALATADTAALTDTVALLDHPNGHVRDTAQRVLVERGDPSAIDAVKKLVVDGGTPQGRAQALWTLEGLNAIAFAPDTVSAALRDKSEKVRAAAVRLAGVAQVAELLKMVDDKSAEVRVQLALQLSAQSSPEALGAVLKLLKTGGSPLLNDAIACGGRGHELEYLEELLKDPAGKDDKLAKSGLLKMLAGCVMSERRSARVARLLELTAAQAPDSLRQLALANGIAGIPGDGKGKVQPRKLLYLDAPPESLTMLKTKARSLSKLHVNVSTGDKKTLMELIDGAIAWPGKPGVPPPPVVVPLTADQQKLYDNGRLLYAGLCAACHQPTGTGLEGLAPPLVDSEWVLGPAERPIKIVLHGLGGPVNVAGRMWRLEMPPLPAFTDEQIAGVLTYIRREWEHNASPVAPEEVGKVRESNKSRTHAWTEGELNPPKKVVTTKKRK